MNTNESVNIISNFAKRVDSRISQNSEEHNDIYTQIRNIYDELNDSLYGPYDSLEEAYKALQGRESLGRTVGIIENGSVVEYWFKSGINDLVKKLETTILTLSLVDSKDLIIEENNDIILKFIVKGSAPINKCIVYQVTNGNEIAILESNSIGKDAVNTLVISHPNVAGIYTYRIKVTDIIGNYALSNEEQNYLEYTVRYGSISTIYNFTQLNTIKIKNHESVANSFFQLNISLRDDSFNIEKVLLSDIHDEYSSNINIELFPYINKLTPSRTYLGNNYYFLPDSDALNELSGKQCSIVVEYKENGNKFSNVRDIFKLLNIDMLDLVSENDNNEYYVSIPSYYGFELHTGAENISVMFTEGNDSDFSFETTTIYAYRKYSLRIIPKDIKINAKIAINYSFKYNNQSYSGTLERVIGNISEIGAQQFYEPELGSTISLDKIIDSNINDYDNIENLQYYKIISETIQKEYHSSSFILDLYCKINQQNDKTKKFLTITYGGVEIASINEDEISCYNIASSLTTDTPLNEWVQIGIGINVKDKVNRNNIDYQVQYHAIYINGMVVKNVRIDNDNIKRNEYNNSSKLVLEIGNDILVQKCFLYYNNDSNNEISPMTKGEDYIIYNNYKSHNSNFSEPFELPLLKLMRMSDEESIQYFKLIREKNSDLKKVTKFGNIGDAKATEMKSYDSDYGNGEYDENKILSDASLFRQSVDIKKPAQKEYTVLCWAQWMVDGTNILDRIIVEVHTQGTSTLVYAVPNFKFTFWQINDGQLEHFTPKFIKKEDAPNEYYDEYIYTAKADFMDSAHLNNTPTCNYFNLLIKKLIDSNEIEGSPAARNGMLDAIMGFPIIMEISDTAITFADNFTNIGSFMLNIDKTGTSLGFEVLDNDESMLSCLSFEGTSNDNEHGAAGRFDIPDGEILENYLNDDNIVNEEKIEKDYEDAKRAYKKRLDSYVTIDGNQILVQNLPYVKWCKFLSNGLEYRYPDSDIYKIKDNNVLSKVMDVDHFKALYRHWIWVYNSANLDNETYRRQFVEHFDLDYCKLYFIQLMIYAQTDNLGKNAMFDMWGTYNQESKKYDFSNSKLYPRPYDLDSEAGLDNNGNDNIATFVEIKPEFSLDYDPNFDYSDLEQQLKNDQTRLLENVLDNHKYTLQDIKIHYGTQDYDRYHFSSNSSKLWINFYKNFRLEIESFYTQLRKKYNYNAESIISLCKESLIDVLGVNQYNKDFVNKYLDTKDQWMAYGNRWYKFKKWITKRFAFCDSYFDAYESATYSTVSQFNYNIKIDSPQYITQQYQENKQTKFVIDNTSFNAGSGAATKFTLKVNQPSVFETNLFKYVTRDDGSNNFSNILSLDVSGNKNSGINSISSLVGDKLDNLKYLNISNSNIQTLILPVNVKTLVAKNVSLNYLVIPENSLIEEITLENSNVNQSIMFNLLPKLKKLDLTNCTINQDITFSNLPSLENLIMKKTIFRGNVIIQDNVKVTVFDFSGLSLSSISFSGVDLNIDTINFHNTTFNNSSININAIVKNIKNLYFDGCIGLSYIEISDESKTFDNLNCFSIKDSSIISLGSDSEKFDCKFFKNISLLKRVKAYDNDTNDAKTFTDFTFTNTLIKEIININWTGKGCTSDKDGLFMNCMDLISISGTLNLQQSIQNIFRKCYALTALPTINIDNTNEYKVTNASYAFLCCKHLSYGNISSLIKKCKNVEDFTAICQRVYFEQSQKINLNDLFRENKNVKSLAYAFSGYASSYETTSHANYRSISNHIVIEGQIPESVTSTERMFWQTEEVTIQYDLLAKATNLETLNAMFASCTVTLKSTGSVQLPTILHHTENGEDVIIQPTHIIRKNFFPEENKISNLYAMFYNSNIITNDSDLLYNMNNLTSCQMMFCHSALKSFAYVYNKKEYEIYLNVSNMWSNNPVLENIAGCFTNCYNVYCNNLIFNEAIDSSKTIDISGLFGLSNANYRNKTEITIDLDSIAPQLTTNIVHYLNSTTYTPGTFEGRKVNLTNTENSTSLLSKLSKSNTATFKNSTIYISDNITTFDLSNVNTTCSNMFYGCRLYKKHSDLDHTYNYDDRKYVTVKMPTSCSTYTKMFENSSLLQELPTISAANASNLQYMFAGCVVMNINLELNAHYFENCKNSLANVSYMFYNNKYIIGLQYDSEYGLFEGCTKLTTTSNMFAYCHWLQGGIPSNLFGTTELQSLVNMSWMFRETAIFYNVENASNKWITASTLSPLTNLSTIEGMFYNTRIRDKQNSFSMNFDWNNEVKDIQDNDVKIVSPLAFTNHKISNIKQLFKYSNINIPFEFAGFEIGEEAFFDSNVRSINVPFVNANNILTIINVDRMFYMPSFRIGANKIIENLKAFVDELNKYENISKRNIAGNLENEGIDTTYTQTVQSYEQAYSLGYTLGNEMTKETAESTTGAYERFFG